MKNSIVLKTILFLLGLFLIVIGAGRLVMPVEFYSFVGVALGSDITLLSEARGVGGMMLGSGILIFLGVFLAQLRFTSTILASLVFLSFGFARLLGIGLDGMPAEEMVQGIFFEFAFGVIALIAFLKYRKK
jgi:hypothetical protein